MSVTLTCDIYQQDYVILYIDYGLRREGRITQ